MATINYVEQTPEGEVLLNNAAALLTTIAAIQSQARLCGHAAAAEPVTLDVMAAIFGVTDENRTAFRDRMAKWLIPATTLGELMEFVDCTRADPTKV
jgi:hypothetical protein